MNCKMLRFVQSLVCYSILLAFILAVVSARPPSNDIDVNNQELDAGEPDMEELRNTYYDIPNQSLRSSIPLNRLQLLIAQYRPNAYMRSSNWNSMNGLYRFPETKRQVRYRQCYFNPISCFKK